MSTEAGKRVRANFIWLLDERSSQWVGLMHDIAAIEAEARRAAPVDAEIKRLRAALEGMVRKWASHSGSCCTFDADGRVIVTEESCECGPVERQARAALAPTPSEP